MDAEVWIGMVASTVVGTKETVQKIFLQQLLFLTITFPRIDDEKKA